MSSDFPPSSVKTTFKLLKGPELHAGLWRTRAAVDMVAALQPMTFDRHLELRKCLTRQSPVTHS